MPLSPMSNQMPPIPTDFLQKTPIDAAAERSRKPGRDFRRSRLVANPELGLFSPVAPSESGIPVLDRAFPSFVPFLALARRPA